MSRAAFSSATALATLALLALAPPAPEPIGHTLKVPLDHRRPGEGTGTLYYEMGAPYDPKKPTVFIVADGQQFYVRKGAVKGLQDETFGDAFNVVGVVGRGFSDDIAGAAVPDPGHPNWARAYRILNSGQWVEDLDAVRRALLGKDGRVLLYGASGGGFLLHQYLAAHGRHVSRAFSQCAVMRALEAGLRLNHDHFWSEIGVAGPGLRAKLREALRARPERRPESIQLLQRQNFFVTPERLAEERAALIEELLADDLPALSRRKQEYQVDAVSELLASRTGAAIRVRIYESVQPLLGRLDLFGEAVHPNIENEYRIALPLLQAHEAGAIPAPVFDVAALRDLRTEVFILAGRQDHTVDYRTQIALASIYRDAILFIADDNHMFARLKEGDAQRGLVQTFLLHGLRSPEMRSALERAEPARSSEAD